MRLLEVKNNLAKVQFEDTETLVLGGFLVISDQKTPYVAQIMSIKTDLDGNTAVAKLLFTYDEEGIVKNYNGTIPAMTSEISILYSKELLDILPVNVPIKLGQLAQQPFDINVDKEIFENNLLVCSNNLENTNLLLDNFMTQFEQKGIKSVIFDLDGKLDFENKIKFPADFKLPLNYDVINYIYENDLNDIDPTSKAIIQDIFIEVQEYTKTVADGFLPFDMFMDVVDAQYRETKIGQLVLLKNKLLKYRDAGVFANNAKEAKNLSKIIEYGRNLVIDLSGVQSETLQAQVLEFAYGLFNKLEIPVYSFVRLDNSYASKPLLKLLTTNTSVTTTVITGHEFKYLRELKSIAKNIIFFAPLTIEHDFASYNIFLNKLNTDEFIVVGDLTQHIPFIVQIESLTFEEEVEEEHAETEIEMEESSLLADSNSLVEEINSVDEVPGLIIEEEPLEIFEDENESLVLDEPIELVEDAGLLELPDVPEISLSEDVVEEVSNEALKPELVEESAVEFEEITTEKLEEETFEPIQEPELEVDSFDELSIEEPISETIDIVEEPIEESTPELNEADLDFIEESFDEDNSEQEVEDDDAELPIIPVYPVEEPFEKSPLEYDPGERVSHPKYGEGVVEKMINYGTKKLCQIMFSGDRRRLLDPAISEITRL